MDDQTDDWSRLQTAFRLQYQMENVTCSVNLLRKMGDVLREGDWNVTAIIETGGLQDEKTCRPDRPATQSSWMNIPRCGAVQ
jgi:hypothetical protein